jgi:hypothetical protein
MSPLNRFTTSIAGRNFSPLKFAPRAQHSLAHARKIAAQR